eukprot:tig00020927_g15950.t1
MTCRGAINVECDQDSCAQTGKRRRFDRTDHTHDADSSMRSSSSGDGDGGVARPGEFPLLAGVTYKNLPEGLPRLERLPTARAPWPPENEHRLALLRSLEVFEQPANGALEGVCRATAALTGSPVAIVTALDERRVYFLAAHGYSGSEAPRDESLCVWTSTHARTVVVEDLCATPLRHFPVCAAAGTRFYAAAPLVEPDSGHVLGTLCVLDAVPRKLSEEQVKALEDMGQVAVQLMAQSAQARRAQRAEAQHRAVGRLQRLVAAWRPGGGQGFEEAVAACLEGARESLPCDSVRLLEAGPPRPPAPPAARSRPRPLRLRRPPRRPRRRRLHRPPPPHTVPPPRARPGAPDALAEGRAGRAEVLPAGAGAPGPLSIEAERCGVACFCETDAGTLAAIASLLGQLYERRAGEEALAARERTIAAQEARLVSNERTERVLLRALDAFSDAIAVVDPRDGAAVYSNRAWTGVTGWEKGEILGRRFPPPGLLPPEAAERLALALERRERAEVETAATSRAGRALRLQIHAEPVWPDASACPASPGSEAVQTVFVVCRDVTALHAAEEASRAKSRFLSVISHEMRTPLNGTIGSAALLAGEPGLSDEARELVDTLASCGEALLALVNNILDYAKIESAGVELASRPFDLPALLDAAVGVVASQLRPPVELSFLIDPGVPRELVGDEVRLKQVLINLLSNALKFSERGDVWVRVSVRGPASGPPSPAAGVRPAAPAGAPAPADSVELLFAVHDQGIGIPSGQIPKLFRPFAQVDDSATRRHGGSGLGLSISRALCRAMAGDIWCESEEGVGSVFYFTARLALGAAPGPGRGPSSSSPVVLPRPGALPAPCPVVVADASPKVREMCAALLREMGATVHAVPSLAHWEEEHEAAGRPEVRAVLLGVAASHPAPALAAFVASSLPGCRAARVLLLASGAPGPAPAARRPSAASAASSAGGAAERDREEASPRPSEHMARPRPLPPRPAPDRGAGGAAGGCRRPRGPAAAPEAACEGKGVGVFVVEDNAVNQKLIAKLLAALGCRTVAVHSNGGGGVPAGPAAARLVFMDLHMPVMGGIEATQRILAHAAAIGRPPPLVCAVTADVVGGVQEECTRAGMRAYISKPFKRSDFAAVLALLGAHP